MLDMSATIKLMSLFPVAFLNSATTRSPFSLFRATRTSSAPRFANSSAAALPTPSVAPVTRKTFPCRSPLIGSSPVRCPMLTSVFAHNCRRYIVDSASWPIVADDLDEPNDLPLLHLVYPLQSSRLFDTCIHIVLKACGFVQGGSRIDAQQPRRECSMRATSRLVGKFR